MACTHVLGAGISFPPLSAEFCLFFNDEHRQLDIGRGACRRQLRPDPRHVKLAGNLLKAAPRLKPRKWREPIIRATRPVQIVMSAARAEAVFAEKTRISNA